MQHVIAAIESSCDDTSVSILKDGIVHSNITTSQLDHAKYGGVVPEIASRAHIQHIVPIFNQALDEAKCTINDISAIAFTRGPGLMGSLMVGVSFAKGLALSKNIPLIEVHHMQAHVLSHFIEDPKPPFPFLCLTVSGGHTQILQVTSPFDMEILGETKDDAAGEAFDKIGKMMGLPYPAGPIIDEYAEEGNPIFSFPIADMADYDFSFSGLKTAVMYFLRAQEKSQANFISDHLYDIAASVRHNIVTCLLQKVKKAAAETDISHIAIAGGVSANQGLRRAFQSTAQSLQWTLYLPALAHCTDNAAMIAQAAWFKYQEKMFSRLDVAPLARMPMHL